MRFRGHQITEESFRRLEVVLRSKARDFGISEPDLDDLVQEVFMQAQKSLDQGNFDGRSALDTWIVGICKNLCLKFRRSQNAAKRKAAEEVVLNDGVDGSHEELESPGPDPHQAASDRQLLERVVEGISQLPDKHRSPLVLAASGLEYKEIAAKLNLPVARVTSRLYEARSKLKKMYAR